MIFRVRQMGQAEGLQVVQARLDTGEWWVICAADFEAMWFLARLEGRFYSGEANRYFHIANLVWAVEDVPVLALAMAHKSYMTATELAAASGLPVPADSMLIHPSTPPSVVHWLAKHIRR